MKLNWLSKHLDEVMVFIESNEEMLELYKNNNLYFPITETQTKINYT